MMNGCLTIYHYIICFYIICFSLLHDSTSLCKLAQFHFKFKCILNHRLLFTKLIINLQINVANDSELLLAICNVNVAFIATLPIDHLTQPYKGKSTLA